MIVVIPCGARKRAGTHPAGDLYTGPYFRACLGYARSVASDEAIYILSARYGLLALSERVESYEATLGQPGAISLDAVRAQARERTLLAEDCLALGGARYVAYCRAIWPRCRTPLDGRGGLGQHLAALSRNRGRLPQAWV